MQKKKSLGQHFLHSAHHLEHIADAATIKKGEQVVEIGPGDGALTGELLARGARVLAIEKDRRLIPILKEKFAGKNFEVLEGDALEVEPENIVHGTYKVVGNIPYYITGALLKKFLSTKKQPSLLVFLMQKEVAERIAREKKESVLSLSVKAYGVPRYAGKVPRGAFVPPPKVDSAILVVSDISRKNFSSAAHEKKFFELVKKAFGQKRKMLRATLKELGKEAVRLGERRAEDLSIEEWLSLSKGRSR